MYPCFFLTKVNGPTGGHVVIIDHVRLLNESGIPARIHLCKAENDYYYGEMLPSDYFVSESAVVNDIDRIIPVIPEADLRVWAPFINATFRHSLSKAVILNQNHFYTFNHGDDILSQRIFNCASHFGTSQAIAKFLRTIIPEDIPIIPVPINHALFVPKLKILRIAFMPRKRHDEAKAIRRLFTAIAPELNGIEFIEIDNMLAPEVATIMNHSAIFLSLAKAEGFGMPALEAMASGCIVVGYTGFGGDEYATADNGVWIEDGDVIEVARALVHVVKGLLSNEAWTADIAANAVRTASHYNLDRTKERLLAVWQPRLGASN